MKKLLFIGLLFIAICTKAQKEYKASNGITYHPKDTVRLGMGPAPNGNFLYIMVAGWVGGGNMINSKN